MAFRDAAFTFCYAVPPAAAGAADARLIAVISVIAEYIRCFSDPATVAATCADYRAGATTDLAADDASAAAGEKITCPTLVLWDEQSFVGKGYQPMEVWRVRHRCPRPRPSRRSLPPRGSSRPHPGRVRLQEGRCAVQRASGQATWAGRAGLAAVAVGAQVSGDHGVSLG